MSPTANPWAGEGARLTESGNDLFAEITMARSLSTLWHLTSGKQVRRHRSVTRKRS